MQWLLFILSFPESYVIIVPYSLIGIWLYRMMYRSHFSSTWTLLLAGLIFWFTFLLGFLAVAFVAQVFIIISHAEKV